MEIGMHTSPFAIGSNMAPHSIAVGIQLSIGKEQILD